MSNVKVSVFEYTKQDFIAQPNLHTYMLCLFDNVVNHRMTITIKM